jgi:hypothetical protein
MRRLLTGVLTGAALVALAAEAFADPGSDASVRYQDEIGPCPAMVGG